MLTTFLDTNVLWPTPRGLALCPFRRVAPWWRLLWELRMIIQPVLMKRLGGNCVLTLGFPARFKEISAMAPRLTQREMLLQSVLERIVSRVLTRHSQMRVRDRLLRFLHGLPRLYSLLRSTATNLRSTGLG